jgi:hypothetical protein
MVSAAQAPNTDDTRHASSGPGRHAGPTAPAAAGSDAASAFGAPLQPEILPAASPEDPQSRPRTRAQAEIHKPKKYTDNTIRYGMTAIAEPTSVQAALANN